MENRMLTVQIANEFNAWLIREEKSAATMQKYLQAVRMFTEFAGGRPVSKELVKEWKESLMAKEYADTSVNAMLSGLNSLLRFTGWEDCKAKKLKIQQPTYSSENKELTRAEYNRLLAAVKDQPQLQLIMETICSTGIRISELQYFTVEAVRRGEIRIRNKGKQRTILFPEQLREKLLDWAQENGIRSRAIFVTRNGKPLDRSNIWSKMKKLCKAAGVDPEKVFPHNLRKLFARAFYAVKKDIAKLADVLGHSSIDTTRIYIKTTGVEHRRMLDRLGLVV